MKPFHSGKIIANWLCRIALIAILCVLYLHVITTLNFKNLSFLIAIAALGFGALNILGGLLSKPGLTVISGLAISVLCVYKLIVSFNGSFDQYFALHIIPLALGFSFFTNGND